MADFGKVMAIRFRPVAPQQYLAQRQQHAEGASLDDSMPAVFFAAWTRPWFYGLNFRDAGVELCAVINNGTSGALQSIMASALANGANMLNAWNVVSPEFPKGRLQTLYRAYGFQTEHIEAYDLAYGRPSCELQQAWFLQGWDGQQLPAVVHMERKGWPAW